MIPIGKYMHAPAPTPERAFYTRVRTRSRRGQRMNRQPLRGGKWFDRDKAQSWEEGERYNGQNFISLATGSQNYHQMLFRSASGAWLLHCWSNWAGSQETWEVISPAEATAWLVINEWELPEDLQPLGAALEV